MIFISCNWDDKDKVNEVYKILKNEFGKEKIFFDSETNLVGDNYWLNINNGLKTCEYFIFFNSFNYQKSSSCGNELLIALDLQDKIKILEIKLDSSITSHKSLLNKVHLIYKDANQTANSIIKSIKQGSFMGFPRESIVELIEEKLNEENDSLNISYHVNTTIIQPTLLFLYNSNIEMPNKVNFNFGTSTSSSGKYDD